MRTPVSTFTSSPTPLRISPPTPPTPRHRQGRVHQACINPGFGASNGRRILARAGSSGSCHSSSRSVLLSRAHTEHSRYRILCRIPWPTRIMVYIPCPKGWPAWFARPRLRHLCDETSFSAYKARLFLVSCVCLARSFQRHCHCLAHGFGICCMRSGCDEIHVMTFLTRPRAGDGRLGSPGPCPDGGGRRLAALGMQEQRHSPAAS